MQITTVAHFISQLRLKHKYFSDVIPIKLVGDFFIPRQPSQYGDIS